MGDETSRHGGSRIVALATCDEYHGQVADDRALAEELATLGVAARHAVWSDARIDWTQCSAVVLRSTWDYHVRFAEFTRWIEHVERLGIPIFNPPHVLRWNWRKRYLRDLEQHGVRIAPTVWLSARDDCDVRDAIASLDAARVVVKPEISASAHQTWRARTPISPVDETRIRRMLGEGGDVLVQAFVDAIETEGEHALVFIDGRFSHAARRRPARGDFRVQTELGGSVTPVVASAELRATAERILSLAPQPTLYARVDMVATGPEVLLMELELVEPSLFFECTTDGAARLARATVRWLGDPAPVDA